MEQARIATRARDTIQACIAVGGLLLLGGIVLTTASNVVGLVVAAVGQAVLLVGLVAVGVKLGAEAVARPADGPVRSE